MITKIKDKAIRHERLIYFIVMFSCFIWIAVDSHIKDSINAELKQVEFEMGRLVNQNQNLISKVEMLEEDSEKAKKIHFWYIIKEESEKYGIEPELIAAVIHTESNFNPRARSRAGALGLMQLMPTTYRWVRGTFGIEANNIYDPEVNIRIGTRYLAYLIEKYGDVEKALAYYNGGHYNAEAYPGEFCAEETRNYVPKVLSTKEKLFLGEV